MIGLVASILIALGVGSLKYPIFGFGDFNSSVFHFIQYAVLNFLLTAKDELTQVISGFIFWICFGLSPHDNLDPTFDIMFGSANMSAGVDSHSRILTNTSSKSQYNSFDPMKEVKFIISWFNNNRFLITLMSLFFVISITFLINLIYGSIKKNICEDLCRKTIISDMRHASFRQELRDRAKTSGYTNFLIKIFLISYCNISSITVYQLMNINYNDLWAGFASIAIFLSFVVGFPCYVFYILWINYANMYDRQIKKKYGAIFEKFKENPRHNKFMVIILIKQLFYAIFLNMSSKLTLTQNSCLLATNLIFSIIVFRIRPYESTLDFIQSFGMSVSTVLISGLNFIFLFDGIAEWLVLVGSISSMVVHGFTFIMFIVVEIQRKCCNKEKDNLMKQELLEHGDEKPTATVPRTTNELRAQVSKDLVARSSSFSTPKMVGMSGSVNADSMEHLEI